VQRLAGDVTRVSRKQEIDRGGNVHRFANATRWNPLCRPNFLFIGQSVFSTLVLPNETWNYAIDCFTKLSDVQ
jgi:hypothetical protein